MVVGGIRRGASSIEECKYHRIIADQVVTIVGQASHTLLEAACFVTDVMGGRRVRGFGVKDIRTERQWDGGTRSR
jgi:hypothetical protein